MMQYKLLIVEDDAAIASLLTDSLARWGFMTHAAKDFSDIMPEFSDFQPHLVLMDISLPFFNGFYWCDRIRSSSNVPILFLSSHTESMDIVMAVNMGGDDYITKPFSMDVLLAKINALLRRAYCYYGERTVLSASSALLDAGSGVVSGPGGSAELTKNEQKILSVLMQNKGAVVARTALMQRLWDSDSFIDDNTLTVNINRLRKKLEGIGLADLIVTKKGEGYLIND